MSNKLKEILEEFEILLRTIKPETHDNIEIELKEREKVPLREFLKTTLVKYAKDVIPTCKGDKECSCTTRERIDDRIYQDLQSLNN